MHAYTPALHLENLGDGDFKKRYGLKYAYVIGAMANGITSVEMVKAAGSAGMLAFFGAAGLAIDDIAKAIHDLKDNLRKAPFGFNLIHSPNDPELEKAVVKLYLDNRINLVSASAYLDLTLPLVYYRVKGIREDQNGQIIVPNRVIGKVSRVEVARKFFSPPPEKFLKILLEKQLITQEEASLASHIPMVDDLTAEADSAGHTDNRPALSLFPTMIALRDEIVARHKYTKRPSVGLGGGIATPYAAAAAFSMGAAYVLAGTIHQCCLESGISQTVREMLANARQADVIMAPSADMFEMGVKVQVLKRGTMFPLRAAKLYELYSNYDRFDSIPAKQRVMIERDYFRCSFEEEWEKTREFFLQRDPEQINHGERNPKIKMALVFRSYLGKSSMWAKIGDATRKIDYQIWCGPSMGAFNEWVKGSFLEKMENRDSITVAMNIIFGAAVIMRINWIKSQGIKIPPKADKITPMRTQKILELI